MFEKKKVEICYNLFIYVSSLQIWLYAYELFT